MEKPDVEFVSFLKSYPTYPTTHLIDDLRATEYSRLDLGGHVYLDYTGGGLYAESQLRRHTKLLAEHVFGNPHSSNPTSLAATQLVEHAREYVLHFFNADPNEYIAIFTSNASGALKLVGESYPFVKGRYLLTFDNHNSVNGIREFAHARGGKVTYIPVALPDMRADASGLRRELAQPSKNGHNLFAYPAQSNFSSVQHPLEWIEEAHKHGWDVLLDAAAFVPTSRTTIGTFGLTSSIATKIPRATSSQRVMPPKMLKRMTFTAGSAVMILRALTTFSGFDDPPMSRKLAGSPP